MNDYFLREGFQSYYVVKKEDEASYEERIIKEQKCQAILPFVIRRVDDESYYYYQTSGCLSLEQKFKNSKSGREEYEIIYQKILEAVEELEEYLLPAEGIFLEANLIFYDERKARIQFCYSPGRKKDLMEQLCQLTEEFLEWMDYDDRELVEYLYGIHEEIAKGILPSFWHEKEKDLFYETDQEAEEEEGIFELEEEDEIPIRNFYEVKQSREWYAKIGISLAVSGILMFFFGYQILGLLQYGFQIKKIKVMAVGIILLAGNLGYLLRMIKMKTESGDVTTILTDGDSIDKII